MASTATPSNPYTFQRASTTATRSLLSNTKPAEIPSSSSNDVRVHDQPTLHRQPTNHYEQAAAAATKADIIPATTANSAAVSVADGPGAKRQQSFKMSDFKAQQSNQSCVCNDCDHGFSTTQK